MAGLIQSLGAVDLCVVILYIASMIGIGIWAGKRVKKASDFTTAGQGMPLKIVVGSTVATCLGASIAFGNLELIHETGLSGLVAVFFWYVGWLFLVLMAKRLRASGATSIPTYLEMRYNHNTRRIGSYCVLIMTITSVAAQYLAIGSMCVALDICDKTTGVIVGAVVILLFTVFSGLWGVAITDTIQSVLLVVGIGFIVPVLAFKTAGGWNFVISNTDPNRLNPLYGIAPLPMLGWFFTKALNAGAHPAYAQRLFSAKDDKTAVRGMLIADLICVVVFICAALPAFTIPQLFPNIASGDEFTPLFIAQYVPTFFKGLLISALLGLLLTTGDTFLLLTASTITDDIIRPLKPNMEDKKMMTLNRMICVFGTVVITVMALKFNSIYQVFKVGGGAYAAGVFFPLILGVFWKKCEAKAANWAMGLGCGVSFLWDILGLNKVMGGLDGPTTGAVLSFLICVIGSYVIESKKSKIAA